ncbi:MAG: hypothetical protein R3F56_17535 [Planctomycetota bacterium]
MTMYFPTGVREGAVLSLDKEAAQGEVILGATFDYRIRVTNLTKNALEHVAVTETIDPSFKLASSVPAGRATDAGVRFDLGSLAVGESKVITLTGAATKTGSLQNCSSVTYDVACCFGLQVTQPALEISQTIAPAVVLSCDEFTAKVVVSNPGSGAARGVRLSNRLPEGVLTHDGKASLDHDFGTLEPGQSKEATFKLKAARAGSYSSVVEASANGGLAVKAVPASIKVVQPVLTVTSECPTGTQQLGRRGEFKFTVKNTGDAECKETKVTVALVGADFVSADNGGTHASGKVAWTLGALAPGQAKTVATTVRMMKPGTVSANAQASSRCAVDAVASCQCEVLGVADIGSLLTDDQGVRPVGEDQIYRCEVENQGQVDLTDVRVVATWPTELTFVGHGAKVQSAPAGNTITWNFGSLKPKQKVSWTLTLKASKAGEYVIHTSTSAKEIKNKMEMDEITTFVD